MALYARYLKEGSAFAKAYEEILLETGRMDAVSLTARAGFDIESKEFWKSGIDVFVSQIDEFEKTGRVSRGLERGETEVTYDIILAGVGGQGVLSIATIIARAAMIDGLTVRQSEVHGMSQRGRRRAGAHAHFRQDDFIRSHSVGRGGHGPRDGTAREPQVSFVPQSPKEFS